MADKVIEHHDSSPSMALVVGILLLIAVMAFFLFGGVALFDRAVPVPNSGAGTTSETQNEGGSVNVDIPDEINVNTNP